MKRIVVALLLLGLLSSIVLPTSAAETDQALVSDLDLSIDTSALAPQDPTDALECIQARLNGPAVRGASDDNLVFPGSMLEKHCFTPGTGRVLSVGVMQTGKAGQYYCLLIYKGSEPAGEPLCVMYDYFPATEGLFTKYFKFHPKDWEPGQYTAVTCTAVLQGDVLHPVENTAFMTDIYCYNESCDPTSFMLRDADTKEKVSSVVIDPQGLNVVELWRDPVPSYGCRKFEVRCDKLLVDIESAGGYLFLTPQRYGSGELVFEMNDEIILTVPIDVCIDRDGHDPYTVAQVAEPLIDEDGYAVKSCSRCNYIYRERIPSKSETFHNFKDISPDTWYYTSVQEAIYRNLFNGVTADTFAPEQAMTRSMLVTVLWRYEGSPEAAGGQFTDVPQNAWYAQAVNWAAAHEIVNGEGNGIFNPDGKITREQMATILYRYAEKKGLNTEILGSFEGFVDGALVSAWANDGLAWAVGHEIIGGVKDGNTLSLQPQGYATRAQVSAILIRFIHNISEPPRAPEIPDSETALDYGNWKDLYWAFYPDGKLSIGGNAAIPACGGAPWGIYTDQITEIELLYGIQSVGNRAFQNFTSLRSITMADSVTQLDNSVFSGCSNLSEITLSKGLTSIGDEAFINCSALRQIDLPDGLRHLGSNAFRDCIALQRIVVPDSVTDLGERVFSGCVALEYAVLPMALTRVEKYTFSNCNVMTEVVLPLCLEYLDWQVFFRCYALEKVTIPQNMIKMRLGVFYYCTSLKEVYVLSPYFELDESYTAAASSERYPFGYHNQVTVYSYTGSTAQQLANRYGYKFMDILADEEYD